MTLLPPTPLGEGESIEYIRPFHIELLRGGMNRLLLRSNPTGGDSRVEILFQYVQRLDIPMGFEGLVVEDATNADRDVSPWAEVLIHFPDLRVFRLLSAGRIVGRVVAAACSFGEDEEAASASSMFFMMD